MFPQRTPILIVDDMPAIRELIKTYLRQMGFQQIWEASNGLEGLQILQHQLNLGMPIELIISDWNMPEMDGLRFLKLVRSNPQTQSVHFIMLTSENEKDKVLEAIQAGVDHFIIKPFERRTLEEKIYQVWQRKMRHLAS